MIFDKFDLYYWRKGSYDGSDEVEDWRWIYGGCERRMIYYCVCFV